MSRPTAGRQYTIVDGDTLSGIAATAYGNGRQWRKIWKANQTTLRSGDPDLIFPGEVIIIPGLSELQPVTNQLGFEPVQDMSIIIGKKLITIESGSVLRAIDNALDGWSAAMFFDVNDIDFYNLVRPYQYTPSRVYLGRELVSTGYYYKPKSSTGDQRITLEFWSKPADMVDSTLRPGTYEANEIKLSQRAKDLSEGHGVEVIYNIPDDGQFKRVKADKTERIGDHLAGLAKQRGGLMTSTPEGNLLFTQAATGEPVDFLSENTPPLLPIGAEFDGRERYSSYLAISQKSGRSRTSVSNDSAIKNSRFLTFNAPDTTGGDIQTAADWQRNKAIADSLSIDLPLSDWYDSNGNLFKENTIIELFAPTIFVREPTAFLIKSVKYELTVENGRTAILSVVPPGVYSGGEVKEPWLNTA